ncbi:FAD binding domain-containing protein [Georgenia satyanarayanai]|uniref:xanthine dehydrogenase small subunit n=1 Tax=Georgenia satyanarayanai TaxID=860221 RepID=UPI0020406ADD|nr:FAD binding domain-containing protein [Georgenia satyanarayanai]MCM3660630.1 FAD binding domain-containing protein [Georgenia satyanarayanai]
MGRIEVTVNGRSREVVNCGTYTNLLDWLRAEGLTGAKEGCAEGECGACAVLVARPDGAGGSRWTSVNACLPPVMAFDGQEVVTAEGLGKAGGACVEQDLHPVQREMAERGGSQCGYCTPGFVCAMAAEYYRPERATAPQDAGGHTGPNGFDLHALSGNLCRCTGYRPIRDAAYALTEPAGGDPLAERREQPAPPPRHTRHASDGTRFSRPQTLAELLELLDEQPDAVVVAGATDVGVELNLRHSRPRQIIAVDRLEELRGLTVAEDHIQIGAALTLSEIERALAGRVPMLAELFPQFASRLIRNGATLGGNLGTASPIGDAAPALLALGADLVLAGRQGERTIALADYFTGYRRTRKEPGEIIRAVRIPLPLAEHSAFYKVAKRRFDDISSVAIAIAASIEEGTVRAVRIGLGGVAATPLRARATEEALVGTRWSQETVMTAAAIMAQEGTPLDDHRASSRYRSAMLEQALLRFYAENEQSETLEVAR